MDAKALLLGSLCLAAPFADAATLDNASPPASPPGSVHRTRRRASCTCHSP